MYGVSRERAGSSREHFRKSYRSKTTWLGTVGRRRRRFRDVSCWCCRLRGAQQRQRALCRLPRARAPLQSSAARAALPPTPPRVLPGHRGGEKFPHLQRESALLLYVDSASLPPRARRPAESGSPFSRSVIFNSFHLVGAEIKTLNLRSEKKSPLREDLIESVLNCLNPI